MGVHQVCFLVKLLSWLVYKLCFVVLGLLFLRLQVRSFGSVSLLSFLLYPLFLEAMKYLFPFKKKFTLVIETENII